MIQLATLGLTPIVVEEGLKKSIPERLYIIHTKDESNYNFEKEAKKLKKKFLLSSLEILKGMSLSTILSRWL